MAAPFEAMSVVSSPLQVAGILLRPFPWGGVVAGAELTATSDAAITPVTAIRLLLSIGWQHPPVRWSRSGSHAARPPSLNTARSRPDPDHELGCRRQLSRAVGEAPTEDPPAMSLGAKLQPNECGCFLSPGSTRRRSTNLAAMRTAHGLERDEMPPERAEQCRVCGAWAVGTAASGATANASIVEPKTTALDDELPFPLRYLRRLLQRDRGSAGLPRPSGEVVLASSRGS